MTKVQEVVKKLKKIDLHRHIEGAVSPKTILALCHKNSREKKNLEYFKKELVLSKKTRSLDKFIKKLGTRFLKKYVRSSDDLGYVFKESIKDAARDNISYLELRFTLSNFIELDKSPEILIKKINEAIEEAARDNKIKVKLILGIKRDDPKEINFEVVRIARGLYKTGEIVGLDLAGNEHFFPNLLFKKLAGEIKRAGIPFIVHAGEASGAESVRTAIEQLGAIRIGHGVRAIFDSDVIDLIVKKNILLEVCSTSNLHTSVYDNYEDVPIRKLLEYKVPILICTDDPITSGITITSEVTNLIKRKIITLREYKNMLKSAHQYYLV